MTYPETTNTFTLNMDEIARILVEVHHIIADVFQTGGGCATIYAGTTYKDAEGDDRAAASAGPGSYGWDRNSPSLGDITDFCVGPDDDGESGYVDVANVGAITEADIAKIIAAQAAKTTHEVLTADEVNALGFDGTAKSAPAWLTKQRTETQAWCDARSEALHAAYAKGATPDDAVAAADAAMNNWTYTADGS